MIGEEGSWMHAILEQIYNRSPAFIQSAAVTYEGLRFARDKYTRGYRRFLAHISGTQWLAPDQMRAYQDQEVRRVVRLAHDHVPYYRRLFRELGITPDDIKGCVDLQKRIPVTSKEAVRKNPDDFCANNLRKGEYVVKHTSGSTGKPLTIRWEKRGIMREYAFIARHRSWAGVSPRDPHAHFGGRSVVPVDVTEPPFWRYNAAERQTYFSSYHLSERFLPAYIEKLRRLSPAYIQGYPSSQYIVARYILDNNLEVPKPRACFSSTETLLPSQRAAIERAYATRVYDRYGQTELASAITQCERGSYHINADYSVVDILRSGEEAAPGETGEMVCTGFVNSATVLLRYETGDTAIPRSGSCECGRTGLPLIEGLQGRLDDLVVTPDGRLVGRLDHVYKNLTAIIESQIVQVARDRLEVKIVASPEYSAAHEAELLGELHKRVGTAMHIEIKLVDCIPRGANGKLRAVVTRIPDAAQLMRGRP